MTSYYFKNIAGCRPNQIQMANISHPRFELYSHVTLKTVQSGAVLGAALIGPITSLIKGQRDCASIRTRSFEYAKKGMLIGLVWGPVLAMAKLRTIDSWEGVYDRSYRLRYNKGQVRTDRLCFYGTLIGMGAAHYFGEELCRGAVFGFASGTILAGAMSTLLG